MIDAEGLQAARQKLRAAGKYPVSIREAKETAGPREQSRLRLGELFHRVKPAQVAILTRQLATLIGAGFPLVSALDALLSQTEGLALKRTLARVKDLVVEGNGFAQALAQFPSVFPPIYVNMVRAGETSGTLEIVLERLADITEKQQALANRIKAALAYPVFMLFFGTLVLVILLTYIVPTITTIFSDMKQQLPAATRILIGTSDFLKENGWMIAVFLAAALFALRRWRKSPAGRRRLDAWLLKFPGAGGLIRKLAVGRFSRTLGSLLENGVTLLTALDIVRNIVGNERLAEAVSQSAIEVGKGRALWLALSETGVFPGLAVQMIQVGEQSGELEKMLYKIADVFENEVETTILRLTSYLEPVMILVMGCAVGFIVLSICLPIFEMNQLIR